MRLLLLTGVYCFLAAILPAHAQILPVSNASGNELTQMKITVSRSAGNTAVNKSSAQETKTLPIADVPVLEAGDVLTIQFCAKCPGRSFSDLGYRKLLVFFVNPASVTSDLKDIDSGDSSGVGKASNFAGSIAEIKFDGDLKSKKNQSKIYAKQKFIVPYRSIPLIFLVSNGDYKNELRKTILEKQADVLKLSEQATLISRLPEAVSFLLEVKTALQTPAAYNPDFLQSFVQRAQFFRFNQTDCFRQTYFYPTDEAKLGCLVKNVNPDQLTNDIQDFSLARFARTGAAEGVAQLRSRYDGLSVFFDAASAAIEIIGRLFQKKPLNIQFATLQTVSANPNNLMNQNNQANQISQANQLNQSSQSNIANGNSNTGIKNNIEKSGYLSLRQMATNSPMNTEKALIIAPLKWREREEIVQADELQKTDILTACRCLHLGKNIFWLDTDNALVRQEIKNVSVSLERIPDTTGKPFDSSPNSQTVQTLALGTLPVSPADQSLTLAIDDSLWRKIKDWRQAKLKVIVAYAFEQAEKEIDVNVPQTPNWQILRNWNDLVKKGEQTVLKLTPNTVARKCLDRIVLTDERKQSVELSPLGEYTRIPSGQIALNLTARLLDKFQAGKITIEVYENGEAGKPAGRMTFTLVNK